MLAIQLRRQVCSSFSILLMSCKTSFPTAQLANKGILGVVEWLFRGLFGGKLRIQSAIASAMQLVPNRMFVEELLVTHQHQACRQLQHGFVSVVAIRLTERYYPG